jgi:hypothetical protein
MPPKKETKKATEKKSPKNSTKKNLLVKGVFSLPSTLFQVHPLQGVSKENKVLEALLSNNRNNKEDVEAGILDKEGRIILKRDNIDKYILELFEKTSCNKAYQFRPEQQTRSDELMLIPAASSKPEKNSLKKILATMIDVPLSSLNSTNKFGLAKQEDFVKLILCLENYFQEQRTKRSTSVLVPGLGPLDLSSPEPKIREQEQEHEQEQGLDVDELIEGQEQGEDDQVLDKTGRIILKRDTTEKYILELFEKTSCNSAYQFRPEQQERSDELMKIPAASSKPEKNSLKKILATLIDVPLSSLDSTKKFGLAKQEDFVKMILCLENYFQEHRLKMSPSVLEEGLNQPLVPSLGPLELSSEVPNLGETEDMMNESSPTEEVRKVLEDEDEEDENGDKGMFGLDLNPTTTTSLVDTDVIEKNEFETQQEEIEDVPKEPAAHNSFLKETEKRESQNMAQDESFQFLYPEINDPNFNIKIAKHKEFSETKYDGNTYDIEEHAKMLCHTEFELTPHQLFVKNFLSMQTPYNCLLLYHSLGTGKTCSSIGIAEDMRAYMQQVGMNHQILVIASPNVQENYRLQLFDERKLKLQSGLWKLNTCIGEALLKEINPTNVPGVPKDRIISEINGIINKKYRFMGYGELANYIKRVIQVPEGANYKASELKELKAKKIQKYFENRLIIIDEVHNIRLSEENKEEAKTASLLMEVARYTKNLRLLLLSATPMYNSYKEIIWLTNLINTVDKRSLIRETDIFDKEGNFKEKGVKQGKETEDGKELLIRKLTGYISYVRGENPYTFPYRIYPDVFSPEHSLASIRDQYPAVQMNNRDIDDPLQNIPVFITKIGDYQAKGYDFLMKHMRNKSYNVMNKFGEERELPSFENMDSFGYTYLLKPLEALDIVFPNKYLDTLTPTDPADQVKDSGSDSTEHNEFEDQKNEEIVNNYVGKKGLSNVMSFTYQKSPTPNVYDYEYRPAILENPNHGRIFHPDRIGNYSNKIAKICDCVKKSRGIVLIYSQYIEGSIVPLALALEEMGLTRFSSESYARSLFKTPPTEPVDSLTMKPRSQFVDQDGRQFSPARYVMITGNKAYSPNNLEDIKYVTNPNNMNGEKVKVVIISKAGSEGLDFKCIRQVHILDPWYNMNRIEQIIGRGVRNFSHCLLEDFKERNVEIYLHATLPRDDEEPADLYVYRYAEKKARQIGKVSRLLKEISVDCLLNIGQHNFTIDQLNTLANNKNMTIRVSSRPDLIPFQIGDRDYSDICDYTTCPSATGQSVAGLSATSLSATGPSATGPSATGQNTFQCKPNAVIETSDIIQNTYTDDYANMNYSGIVKRIRDLFKNKTSYRRDKLIKEITIVKPYPEVQIDFALSRFINNKNETLYDEYGRVGYLMNRNDFYVFQPIELTDETASLYDRSLPIDYKRSNMQLELGKTVEEEVGMDTLENALANPLASASTNVYVGVKTLEGQYRKIIAELQIAVDSFESTKQNRPEKITKDADWGMNLGYVYPLLSERHKISDDVILRILIDHFIECLPLVDRVVLLRYCFSQEGMDSGLFDKLIYGYFSKRLVKIRGFSAIILSSEKDQENGSRKRALIQDQPDKSVWSEALPLDEKEIKRQSVRMILVPLQQLHRIFGFMQVVKETIIFKILDTSNKTKIGSACSGESKKDVLKRINMVSDIQYTNETSENTIDSTTIVKTGLCVLLEVLFRYYDEIQKDGKRWFLHLEQDPYQ